MTLATLATQGKNWSNKQDFRFSNVSTLLVKVTKRCNLDCEYCYENITRSGDMDIKTFRDLAETVFFSSLEKKIQFVFHGGEPTLLSDKFYIEAFAFCKKLAELTGKELHLSIQTNLVRLSQQKIELLKENNVGVGVSLDGPAELAGAMRPSAQKTINNFLLARESGLKVGILMTINPSNFDKFIQICDWLYDVMGVSDFKANVIYAVGSGYEIKDMKPEQVFEAQKSILDYMIKYKAERVIEHNLMLQVDWFSRRNNHQQESLCHAQRCGAGRKVLGITSDGNLLPCGRFQWNDTGYSLGNLANISELGEYEQKVDTFHSLYSENWFNCSECSAKKICGFGCQAFISRSKSHANVECIPTKMLYNYFLEREADVAALHQALIAKKYIILDNNNDALYNDTYSDLYSDYSDRYKDYKDNK